MYHEIVYPYIESDLDTIPIPLVDIKRYLKLPIIEDADLDADLTLMCFTALEYAEKYCRQIFAERTITTNRVFWGEFRNGELQNYFTLRRTPAKSITKVTYDEENVLDSSLYKVIHRQGEFDVLQLKDLNNLPELQNEWYPIEIEYIAGYTAIPKDIQQAMLYHIASMWLNRGDYDNNNLKCPQMARDIYKKYKIIEVGS